MTVFAKPNVLVNEYEIQNGKFVTKTLLNYTMTELIEMANTYSLGKIGQSAVMRKIFKQIEKEKN